MSFDETDWLAYRQANLLFAEAVKSVVNSGDIVWVQGMGALAAKDVGDTLLTARECPRLSSVLSSCVPS